MSLEQSPLNPQKLYTKLNQSKYSKRLPQLANYDSYALQKSERKNVQCKRQNIEQNVSYLYRQAQKTNKQYSNKHHQLIEYYQKRFLQEEKRRDKTEERKKRMEQLQEQRNNNHLVRYMHLLKKEESEKQLIQKNQLSASRIRHNHHQSELDFKVEKKKSSEIRREKNQALYNATSMGTRNSRAKALFTNHYKSGSVKNELKAIEAERKQKQLNTIDSLSKKQHQLSHIVEKTKRKEEECEHLLHEAKDMTFEELYSTVVDKGFIPSQRKTSRKKTMSQTSMELFS